MPDTQLSLMDEKPVSISPVAQTMQMIATAATSGASVEVLRELFALKKEIESDEARKAFHAAMARFKQNPPKISKNNHVKVEFKGGGGMEYDHATLDHACDAIVPALAAVGIRHRWETKQEGAQIYVTCILSHDLGHSESTMLNAGPDTSGSKNGIQAIGATVTYLQRYTLLAATGSAAAGVDTDGRIPSTSSDKRSVDEKDVVSNVDNIGAAADEPQLRLYFNSAYKEAQELNDREAMKLYREARDKRKAELQS